MAPEKQSSEISEDLDRKYVLYRICNGREKLASADTAAEFGVVLIKLAEAGMFVDGKKSCPLGIFDSETRDWLVKPWLPFPTPKNASDGARAMAAARWAS